MTYINTALTRVMLAVSGLRARLAEERGQDLLEYALLGGLIAIALLLGFVFFQDSILAMANNIGACIDFSDSTLCDPGP